MSQMKDKNEWCEGDETWDLLGKSASKRASHKFLDDTVRAVKLLPEADAWWPRVLRFSPLVAMAACVMLAAVYFMQGAGDGEAKPPITVMTVSQETEEQWVQIEEVAEAEMLVAAADHLESFSDQELVSLIGF